MAAPEESLSEMRADEACAAGDEKPHAAVAFRPFRARLTARAMTFPVLDTVAHGATTHNEGANSTGAAPCTHVARSFPEAYR